MGHSSLYKAASVVGLGRASVKDIPFSKDEPWRMDVELLEQELKAADEGNYYEHCCAECRGGQYRKVCNLWIGSNKEYSRALRQLKCHFLPPCRLQMAVIDVIV
jgi:hypothetical protein